MQKLYEVENKYYGLADTYINSVVGEVMLIKKLLKYGFNSLNDEVYGYLGYDEEDFKEDNNGYTLDTKVKVLYDTKDDDGYTILYIRKEDKDIKEEC